MNMIRPKSFDPPNKMTRSLRFFLSFSIWIPGRGLVLLGGLHHGHRHLVHRVHLCRGRVRRASESVSGPSGASKDGREIAPFIEPLSHTNLAVASNPPGRGPAPSLRWKPTASTVNAGRCWSESRSFRDTTRSTSCRQWRLPGCWDGTVGGRKTSRRFKKRFFIPEKKRQYGGGEIIFILF